MLEKIYNYKGSNEKLIEKIIDDDNVMINHIILSKNTGVPEHYSNSNVYITIIKGTMTLKLEEQEAKKFEKGDIINIPFNTKMNINNYDDEILDFFVTKSPNPKNYEG
jgi:quercetin dioxygenase-like cupin family protein